MRANHRKCELSEPFYQFLDRMNDELKIKVEWPSGTMLPVLTHSSVPGSQLIRLLRFACNTNEEIILFHHGIPLDLELSLEAQLVNDGDILKANIICRQNQNEIELSKKIRELAIEAAKLSDRQFAKRELLPIKQKISPRTSSDDFIDYNEDSPNPPFQNHAQCISSDPLPSFWEQGDNLNGDPHPKLFLQRFSSFEEAGNFLANNQLSWNW